MAGWADMLTAVDTVFKPVSKFMEDNPIATAILGSVIGGVFDTTHKDAKDLLKYESDLKIQREDEERKRREKNLMVGNIDLGMKPSESKKFLNDSGVETDPQSIIQNRRPGLINSRAY